MNRARSAPRGKHLRHPTRRWLLGMALFAVIATATLVVALHLAPLACWLGVATLVTALAMGWDKARARAGQPRVPELALLVAAGGGGGLGLLVGMLLFRHKTLHRMFWLVGCAALVAWGIALALYSG